ncbi:DUF3467 domain-containing protein [Parerythrobacter aestuarii]|uniref:DUF3467 domain-containing protein n=1 Tax=Parerythrobacter aestuarii TaxID=3020909 RepID=UPI0024DE1F35|nr:DUF3467 domain-containing protein [Parerythrobacter aestuarii]
MSDEGDRDEPTSGESAARDLPDPVYVNHCAVTLSLSTAELDFGQASEADQSVRVKSRLRTSPAYFRQLGDLIRAECRRYDETYGLGRSKGGN